MYSVRHLRRLTAAKKRVFLQGFLNSANNEDSQTEALQILLDSGCDVNEKWTPHTSLFSAALKETLLLQFQATYDITIDAHFMVKSLYAAAKPASDKTIELSEQVQLQLNKDDLVLVASVLEYYKGLCILANGYAIAGQHKGPSKESPSTEVTFAPLPDNLKYAVRVAGKALPDRPLAELSVLEGSTALHFASKRGDVDMVRQLVLGGADVQIRNAQGKRPIDVARTFFGGQVPQALAEALLADPEALSTKDSARLQYVPHGAAQPQVSQEVSRPPRKHFRFPFFEELSTSDGSEDELSRSRKETVISL
ncbi:hypothetical protein AK812_SmicGene5277 [Symbiodinium microadriaticum]|uniref:Uncharacterized protein n=1 Tax=Symbiodinium microadriaticum TaxID=2951 RepID=A0A1Q9EU87_SYMMI|nr:hypothetical protein AK812_SmicGene5277 [Symbiodinium microadriaticum]